MTHAERLIERIKSVLNSNLTPYRIAKEVGYAGANPVHDLKSGKSDIMKMQLGTALKFEKLYEELEKMTKVYIAAEDQTVYLDKEIGNIGIGKYWAVEIESAARDNDFGTGPLYTWTEPYIDGEVIQNEQMEVMKGASFDLEGNLYEIIWTKKDGVTDDDLQDLSNFADWENPYSVIRVDQ